MLSVLIPVYCYPVGPLVRDLVRQLKDSGWADWEIRVYDDHSPPAERHHNEELTALDERVAYRLLPENLGRAAIRNLLARDARSDNLIFLDADGAVPSDFITSYQPFLNGQAVVCGGRYYSDRAIFADQMLHWLYGTHRESQPAAVRKLRPYQGFQTNNFLAPRALMLAHPFDEETATGYGHEDTLWGWQLKALGIPLIHIDNAVEHLGLETASTFLRKQETAVRNLRLLEASHPGLPSRLGNFAARAAWAKGGLIPLLKIMTPLAKRKLLKPVPASLYWLDLLKLAWYWNERNN